MQITAKLVKVNIQLKYDANGSEFVDVASKLNLLFVKSLELIWDCKKGIGREGGS